MISEPESTDAEAIPARTCSVCGPRAPAGAFCGSCGADLARPSGVLPWLRIRAYSAAPGEHALRPSLTSTLFPHLPHGSRAAFRGGLALLLLALVVLGAVRWQAPLIAISVLAFPAIFLVYLHEADVHVDLPRRTLLLVAATGAALGIGWALFTGDIVVRSDELALGTTMTMHRLLREGIIIPVGAAALMLAPAMLARLFRKSPGESLDGFVFGLLGAVAFTAAATLMRLAPQFATGEVASFRPRGELLVEAGMQGVAIPLTAAAVGGSFGVALWFARSGGSARPYHRLMFAVASVLLLYTAVGIIDVADFAESVRLALELVVTAIALLVLRIALHLALLHEQRDPVPRAPVLCCHCSHVVPDTPFCPNCGVATRAASRSSRAARRTSRPVPIHSKTQNARPSTSSPPKSPSAAVTTHPGYLLPARWYASAAFRHTRPNRIVLALAICLIPVVAAAVAVSWEISPVAQVYHCPPACGRPPLGTPVRINPRFTAPDGGFTVSYPGEGEPYQATINPNGVVLDFLAGDKGTLELSGEAADNRTPRQIAHALVKRTYPDATLAYEIPNAMVGYQPGFGEVDDVYPDEVNGTYARLRVLVLVAVKNGLALIAAADGPYHQFSPDFGNGTPSGVNLQLALDMAKYVNSFTWRGDPSR